MSDSRSAPAGPITVAAALEHESVRLGAPELLAGHDALDRPIRWVHAGEVPNMAALLRGGELLLTTGMGLGEEPRVQRRFVAELADRGVTGLVLELGHVFSSPPRALVDAALEHGLPLIVLHREVPFVEVTEAINQALVDRGLRQVHRADALQREFTSVLLGGGGIPEVLGALAAAVGNPVILEREDGELLYHAVHKRDSADVLAAWDAVRRDLPGATAALRVDLPSTRAGQLAQLIVLAVDGNLADVTGAAMERAASLVALVALQSRQEELLVARERGNLLMRLMDGGRSETEISRQVDAMGFPRGVPYLLPCVLAAVSPGRVPRTSAAAIWTMVWRDVRRELEGQAIPVLGGLMAGDREIGMVVGLASAAQRESRAEALSKLFAASLEREIGSRDAGMLFVGAASRSWTGAIRSLHEVAEAATSPRPEARGWFDATRPDLNRLLWALRDSDDMRAFVRRRLGPLIEHDRQRSSKLLPTVEAYLEHGGHKTETARALHLERQSLYHRLNRIEALLGDSLDDEDTRLGVHVALRARRLMPGLDDPHPDAP